MKNTDVLLVRKAEPVLVPHKLVWLPNDYREIKTNKSVRIERISRHFCIISLAIIEPESSTANDLRSVEMFDLEL